MSSSSSAQQIHNNFSGSGKCLNHGPIHLNSFKNLAFAMYIPIRAVLSAYQGCITSRNACQRILASGPGAILYKAITIGSPCVMPLKLQRMSGKSTSCSAFVAFAGLNAITACWLHTLDKLGLTGIVG